MRPIFSRAGAVLPSGVTCTPRESSCQPPQHRAPARHWVWSRSQPTQLRVLNHLFSLAIYFLHRFSTGCGNNLWRVVATTCSSCHGGIPTDIRAAIARPTCLSLLSLSVRTREIHDLLHDTGQLVSLSHSACTDPPRHTGRGRHPSSSHLGGAWGQCCHFGQFRPQSSWGIFPWPASSCHVKNAWRADSTERRVVSVRRTGSLLANLTTYPASFSW